MFKRNGMYYIEYSASGTQWLSYASGIIRRRVRWDLSPTLRKTRCCARPTGIVTGPGHGSVVKGPDGNWWVFYTIVTSNPPGGRRIGMDPIDFDAQRQPVHTRAQRNAAVGAGTWWPIRSRNGDSGSIAVSVNKLRAMHSQSAFSSERPGHEAAYAIDDSNGTVWQPAENDAQPTLTIDLIAPTEFETNQLFEIDSSRLEFAAGGGFGGRGARGAASAPLAPRYPRLRLRQLRMPPRRSATRSRCRSMGSSTPPSRQDEERGHAVYGVRRDSAHALPFCPFDYDGLAPPWDHSPRHHRVHPLRQADRGPDALIRIRPRPES